jgi:hypothetical protein
MFLVLFFSGAVCTIVIVIVYIPTKTICGRVWARLAS